MSRQDSDYIQAHSHSSDNWREIEQSERCGCFYCLSIYPPGEIDWVGPTPEETAWCPRCGIDSVIGSASGYPITEEFLRKMHAHWFERGRIIGEGDCAL